MFDISIYPQDGPGSLVSKSLAYSSNFAMARPERRRPNPLALPVKEKTGEKVLKSLT